MAEAQWPSRCEAARRSRVARLMKTAAASAAMTALGGIARPSLSRAPDRPQITHGVQSGDVSVRLRRGLGARRPAVAHAGRSRDHRQLQRHQQRGLRRRAAGNRFHRQGADRRSAGRAGHLLSHPLPGSLLGRVRRAAGRALPHRAERPALGLVRVVGRHRGPGLGHRRGARRHAHLRHHAEQPSPTSSSIAATTSMPTARSRRSRSCRTAKSGATSSPRRNRRSPRRSPSFAATTNTICSTTICARSMPKCRPSRNGTTTK